MFLEILMIPHAISRHETASLWEEMASFHDLRGSFQRQETWSRADEASISPRRSLRSVMLDLDQICTDIRNIMYKNNSNPCVAKHMYWITIPNGPVYSVAIIVLFPKCELFCAHVSCTSMYHVSCITDHVSFISSSTIIPETPL